MANYWIGWCQSSYRKKYDGFLTHAVSDTDEGRSMSDRALCGVKPNDFGLGLIPEDGVPGCPRCRKALIKLGVIDAGKNN